MKKLFIIFLISLPAILTAASVGKWDIGGKVGLEQSSNTLGLKAAVKAEYMISEILTWRTDLEVMFPELNDPPAERNPDNFFSFASSFFSVSSAFDVNVQNIIIVNNTMIR